MEEKKVQVFLSNGVEEVEALTSVDLLKRAGADVTIIKVLDKEERDSIKNIKDNEDYSEELETLIIGSHDIAFYADFSILDFEDTSFDDEDFLDLASVDMVVIPGGMGNVNNLMSDKTLLKYLDYQYKKGIYISAICAGPMVLHKAGILNGKNITCYPGCEQGLDNINWQDKNVVVDENIITSKGVGTAIDFALELINTLYGEKRKNEISSEIVSYRQKCGVSEKVKTSKLPIVLIVLILVICGFFTRLYFVTKASLKNQIKNAKLVTEYSDDTIVEQMDTVTFGIDSDGKPIEWIVLRKQGNKALLLSKYLLARTSYHEENDITWENCGLRKELNSDFMKQTFSKNEQNSILTVDVTNLDNEQYGTKGGNNTKDKIFLLSIDQFELFFPKGSVATYKNGKIDCWWLRSPGELQRSATIVSKSGEIFSPGFSAGHEIGIRPALWVEYNANLNAQIQNCTPLVNYAENTFIEQMDTITFGKGSDGKPIEWIVLEKEGSKALLLSKYLLQERGYNDEYKDITWENCTLRKRLNSDFIKQTFSKKEQNSILTTDVVNNDNAKYGTKGGNNTKDKIFLLSIDELKKYFPKGSKATYKHWNDVGDLWWLRSPGYYQDGAAYVSSSGDLGEYGSGVGDGHGVRPALWVKY